MGLTPRGMGEEKRKRESNEKAPRMGTWGRERGSAISPHMGGSLSARDRNKTILIEDMGAWMADPNPTGAPLTSAGGGGEGEGERGSRVDKEKKGLKGKKSKKKTKTGTMSGEGENIFGMSLQELYEQSGHPVPVFVVHCLKYFKKTGALKLEGIFRVSGLKGEVEQMKNLFPTGLGGEEEGEGNEKKNKHKTIF